jgi:hypothetical protein
MLLVGFGLVLVAGANNTTWNNSEVDILPRRAIEAIPFLCRFTSNWRNAGAIAWLTNRTIGLIEFGLILAGWAYFARTLSGQALEFPCRAG